MYYDNPQYAKGRLESTIVNTKDGEPIFIRKLKEVGFEEDEEDRDEDDDQPRAAAPLKMLSIEEIECECLNLKDNLIQSYKLTDLDLSPVNLGYMNTYIGALYVHRTPLRGWKQGLCAETVVVSAPEAPNLGGLNWPYPALYDTIKRNYPSYQEALKQADASECSIAFSPHFAVDHNEDLFYKGCECGKSLELNEGLEYLRQHLDETLEGNYAD
jgi:hypothetical protein